VYGSDRDGGPATNNGSSSSSSAQVDPNSEEKQSAESSEESEEGGEEEEESESESDAQFEALPLSSSSSLLLSALMGVESTVRFYFVLRYFDVQCLISIRNVSIVDVCNFLHPHSWRNFLRPNS